MRTLGNLVDCGLVFSPEGQMSKVTWLKSDCLSMPVVLQHINIHQIMLLYAAKMHADSYWTLIGVIYCPIVYLCAVYQDHILCCMCESAGKHQSTSFFCIIYILTYSLNIAVDGCGCSSLQGAPWLRKVMEFRKTIFQVQKVLENSKGHGKSWKMMIMSWNFYYCTEQFCKITRLYL